MRVIKVSAEFVLPDDQAHRLFISCWYSLVHQQSLDSHRVRCMNALNILEELQRLIPKALRGIELDIKRSAEEALDILESDPVVKDRFSMHLGRLRPILAKLIDQASKNSPEFKKQRDLASFYLKDAVGDLRRKYRAAIFDRLEEVLSDSYRADRATETVQLTATLMSVLIHECKSLEGLFALLRDVFLRRETSKDRDFHQSFAIARKILERDKIEYEAILKMTGWSDDTSIPDSVGGVAFAKESCLRYEASRLSPKLRAGVTKFEAHGPGTLYAVVPVTAADERSAGVAAKEKLDAALDFIRFELEGHRVSTDAEFVVQRPLRDWVRVLPLPSAIPNPRRNTTHEDFAGFLAKCSNVLQSPMLTRETSQKVMSALRFYRLGGDSPGMENKLLNWWTALEYLSRTGADGGIMEQVEKRTTWTLVLGYLPKLLNDLKMTLGYCRIRPSGKSESGGVTSYASVDLVSFRQMLLDHDEQAHILDSTKDYPYLRETVREFAGAIESPESTLMVLKRHEQHVRWHINRIWQLRCDIVHAAEHTVNLTLYCANLEYYLKSVIAFVMDSVDANTHLETMDELFARTEGLVRPAS